MHCTVYVRGVDDDDGEDESVAGVSQVLHGGLFDNLRSCFAFAALLNDYSRRYGRRPRGRSDAARVCARCVCGVVGMRDQLWPATLTKVSEGCLHENSMSRAVFTRNRRRRPYEYRLHSEWRRGPVGARAPTNGLRSAVRVSVDYLPSALPHSLQANKRSRRTASVSGLIDSRPSSSTGFH